MTIRIMSLAAVLIFGAAMGWLLASHWNHPWDPGTNVTAGSIRPAFTTGPPRLGPNNKPQPDQQPVRVRPSGNGSVNDKAPLNDALAQLQASLNRETLQRRLLERRVRKLSDMLARLESAAPNSPARPLASMASAAGPAETPDEPETKAKARTARFLAVGFDTEQEKQLTRRMDEVEMERLYLRDRARREGWLRTPEYRQAAGELRDSLRNEMGEDAYDRFLYASEQDNRVLIDSVLESSPAQQIGLRAGDTIVGYDGVRVFSYGDIRTATANGEAGDPVPLRIERNGEVLELEIARGPMGLELESKSVLP